MKSIYLPLILIAMLSTAWSELPAAKLHSIIVADTSDPKEGAAAQVNLDNIQRFVTEVEENIQLTSNQITYSGPSWKYNSVKAAIDKLPVSADDVVLFYYTGRGFNQKEGSRWPTFVRLTDDGQHLKLEYVISTLQAKAPKFLLIIADVGNDFVKPSSPSTPTVKGVFSEKEENYRRLFLEFRGSLIAISAYPEQLAGRNAKGGYFTTAFLNLIEQNLASPVANWEDIVGQGRTLSFKVIDSAGQERPQNPLIELHSVKKAFSVIDTEKMPLFTVKYSYRRQGELSSQELTKESILRSGDSFKIELIPLTDCQKNGCHVYILEYDSYGNLEQLFPSKNIFLRNPIKTLSTLPSINKSFKLDDKIGTETIHVLAYQKPIDESQLRQNYEKKLALSREKDIMGAMALDKTDLSCEQDCVSQLTFKHEKPD